jgi:hypothetical protein
LSKDIIAVADVEGVVDPALWWPTVVERAEELAEAHPGLSTLEVGGAASTPGNSDGFDGDVIDDYVADSDFGGSESASGVDQSEVAEPTSELLDEAVSQCLWQQLISGATDMDHGGLGLVLRQSLLPRRIRKNKRGESPIRHRPCLARQDVWASQLWQFQRVLAALTYSGALSSVNSYEARVSVLCVSELLRAGLGLVPELRLAQWALCEFILDEERLAWSEALEEHAVELIELRDDTQVVGGLDSIGRSDESTAPADAGGQAEPSDDSASV